MTDYRLISTPLGVGIQRVSDGAFIPSDPANTDFRDYLDWVSRGNTVDPAPVPAPQTVYIPVGLARERLEAAGKWSALVGALSSDMPTLVKLMTLREGLDPADPEVVAMLQAIGADPAVILATPA